VEGRGLDIALVPDRSCGSCNVCCIVPKIDEPALQKLPGCRCRNAQPDGSCSIYEARPKTCQDFFCGWRLLPSVDEALRPDRSGVFLRLTGDTRLVTGQHRFALMVTILHPDGLDAAGLVEAVAMAIAAGVDTYLIVPGPPGHTSCRGSLNDALGEAVGRNDVVAIREGLATHYAELEAMLGKTRPVVLKAGPSAGPAE
jgi:hypothetical protein